VTVDCGRFVACLRGFSPLVAAASNPSTFANRFRPQGSKLSSSPLRLPEPSRSHPNYQLAAEDMVTEFSTTGTFSTMNIVDHVAPANVPFRTICSHHQAQAKPMIDVGLGDFPTLSLLAPPPSRPGTPTPPPLRHSREGGNPSGPAGRAASTGTENLSAGPAGHLHQPKSATGSHERSVRGHNGRRNSQ
jgi:hypothetical protein